MKITSIKQQEKRKDRYSVFVDGKYTFSLSEAALLEEKIITGQELTAQEVTNFKKLSVDDKTYGNALRYAAMRQRSKWEISSYLQRNNTEQPVIESIIDKLQRIGFINDESFALAWVENRRLLKPTSKRRLTQELKQKHVDEAIIRKVLSEESMDERSVLHELIQKKRRQTKYHDELKLTQYLARQGFYYDDIKQALSQGDES